MGGRGVADEISDAHNKLPCKSQLDVYQIDLLLMCIIFSRVLHAPLKLVVVSL